MTQYRILNKDSARYVTLTTLIDEDLLDNPITTTCLLSIDNALDNMRARFPDTDYTGIHSDSATFGDDWVTLAEYHSHSGEYHPSTGWVDERTDHTPTTTPRRTYRVIITDSDDGLVGQYVVTDDPNDAASPRSGPVEFTDYNAALDAADRFRRFFRHARAQYAVVSRYGTTWEEISDTTRRNWEADNDSTTCQEPRCGDTGHFDGYCDRHARITTPTRQRRPSRPRDLCDECETRNVHHDDIDEVWLCDHRATERIDAGFPVTTAHAIPTAA